MLHLLAEAVAVAVQLWVDAPNRSPHLGLQQLEVHRRQLVCFRELHIGLQHCTSHLSLIFRFRICERWPRKSPDIRRRGRCHLGQGS